MEYYDSPILLVVNDGEHQVSTKRFMWSSHNAPLEGTLRDDLLELRYGTYNTWCDLNVIDLSSTSIQL